MKYCVLVVALFACGDDGVHHLVDSGADSPPPVIDAPPSPVTVTVTRFGQPAAGQQVYFQNADSTVVASMVTDANGQASTVMAAGGFVTVLEPALPTAVSNQRVDTFTGVKPGDDLHVDAGNGSSGTADTFNITVPTDPDINAVSYTLATTCGSANITPPLALRTFAATDNPPVQVTLFNCNGTADMLVVTADANGNDLNALFVPAQAVANGVDVTLDATYAPFVAQTFDYTNLPANVVDVQINEELVTTRGFLFEDNIPPAATPNAGTASLAVSAAPAAGATQLAIHSFAPDSSIFSAQVVTDWGPPDTGSSLDYGSVKLGDYTSAPALDTTDETVKWTVGTGAAPDVVLAETLAQRTDGSGVVSSWAWQIVAAGTSNGAIAYPTVPTDVFDFNFAATDTLNVDFVVSSTAPGGYDAVRPHAFSFNPTDFIVGASGRVVSEQLQLPPPALRAIENNAPARRLFQRR